MTKVNMRRDQTNEEKLGDIFNPILKIIWMEKNCQKYGKRKEEENQRRKMKKQLKMTTKTWTREGERKNEMLCAFK